MADSELIEFVWDAMAGGVVGNATYDAIKTSLGSIFGQLSSYIASRNKRDFNVAMGAILETNDKIQRELQDIRSSSQKWVEQSHSGAGDNIVADHIDHVGDIIAGNKVTYKAPSQEEMATVTVALVDAVELHHPVRKTWNEPVFMIAAFNSGDVPIHVVTLGVILTDGRKGDFYRFKQEVIEVGKGANWIIPVRQPIMLETGDSIHGFSEASIAPIEIDLISAIYIESHTGKTFTLEKRKWQGISWETGSD